MRGLPAPLVRLPHHCLAVRNHRPVVVDQPHPLQDSCQLRLKGFAEVGRPDPAPYANPVVQ